MRNDIQENRAGDPVPGFCLARSPENHGSLLLKGTVGSVMDFAPRVKNQEAEVTVGGWFELQPDTRMRLHSH